VAPRGIEIVVNQGDQLLSKNTDKARGSVTILKILAV